MFLLDLAIPEVMDLSGAVEGWMGGFHQSWGGFGGGGSENHPWMNLPRAASTYETLESPGVVTYDGSWDLRTVVGRGGFCFPLSIGEILCGGPTDSATLALIPTLIVFPGGGLVPLVGCGRGG